MNCGYCRGQRSPCTCGEDCGARADDLILYHYCPKAEGYLAWLRGTGLYSEDELRSLAAEGYR